MAAYLRRLDDTLPQCQVPAQIDLDRPETKIGWGEGNDVVVPSEGEKKGYVTIQHEEGAYSIESSNFPISLNGYPISGRVYLQHEDCLRIGEAFTFRFIETESPPSEAEPETTEVEPETSEMKAETAPSMVSGTPVKTATDQPAAPNVEEEITELGMDTSPPDEELKPPTAQDPQSLGSLKCRIRLPDATGSSPGSPGSSLRSDPEAAEITPATAGHLIEIQPLENIPSADLASKFTKRLKMPRLKRSYSKTAEIPSPGSPPGRPGAGHPPTGEKSPQHPVTLRRRRTLQLQDIAVTSAEPGATMMLNITPARVNQARCAAELISPSNGQILPLIKERFIVGRKPTCDLCLMDEYISREQLEFTKTSYGFSVKNIGKNDVIIEKKALQAEQGNDNISAEEKTLKPGDSANLVQEATIILGSQILYYFQADLPRMQTTSLEVSILDRKYKFYKQLAEQKHELLRAGQLQKILTPPRRVFDDLNIGVWFKYFAIGDLSGDFFLTYKRDDALFLCLGDVSGHGPASALWASRISGMFDSLAEIKTNPDEIMSSINSSLMQKKNPKHTLYALVSLIKITPHHAQFCIAGNSVPPLYYSAKGQKLLSLNTPSTPVGMMGVTHFKTYTDTIDFGKDDMLILFTDGVTEAEMIADGSQVEYPRAQHQLEQQIRDRVDREQFLDTFLSWLDQNCEIQDDLSMVLVARI